ncbi:TetR/AcrR family transcriptional regulator [Nocardioides sp. AN3]
MASAASWRTYEASSLPRVLAAALEAFAEEGYEGTSIRDIGARAGLSVPGLYHHHRSKQEILATLMETVLEDLLARCRSSLESAGDDPSARFDAVVECLLRFHMFRRAEAFVASTELRSLEPENRARCVALRDQVQRLVTDVVEDGRAQGVFTTPYPVDAARAVATLCVGVASWYRADGALGPDELVARHTILLRDLVGAPRTV